MRAFVAALFVFAFLTTSSALATSTPQPPLHPGGLISFEHSLIVYVFGIVISLGTAVLIKLLSSLLRKMQGPSAE